MHKTICVGKSHTCLDSISASERLTAYLQRRWNESRGPTFLLSCEWPILMDDMGLLVVLAQLSIGIAYHAVPLLLLLRDEGKTNSIMIATSVAASICL